MAMHHPPHPGEFIREVYLSPHGASVRALAASLAAAPATAMRVVDGSRRVNAEMALRLAKALGRTPESWLAMQYNHDLWHAKRRVNLGNVERLKLTAA